MRWVKEILPPRVRFRWLLITTRLSASSLAGTARTLVAVGMLSEACMFLTTVFAEPRSCVTSPAGGVGVLGLAARDVEPAAGLAPPAEGALPVEGAALGAGAACAAGSDRTGAVDAAWPFDPASLAGT